jgi:hypothetical protein
MPQETGQRRVHLNLQARDSIPNRQRIFQYLPNPLDPQNRNKNEETVTRIPTSIRAIVEHKKERRVAKAQGEVGEEDEVDGGEAEREQVESDKEKGKIGQPKVRLSRSCLGTQK